MAQYDKAIALALKLITKYGTSIKVRRITDAVADPTKPWRVTGQTAVDATGVGVFLDYEQKAVDGETILRGDQKVLIAASGLTVAPAPKDRIVRGTEVWDVVSVQPLKPGDQIVMYEVQVRQ
jgi:hypothetical protein